MTETHLIRFVKKMLEGAKPRLVAAKDWLLNLAEVTLIFIAHVWYYLGYTILWIWISFVVVLCTYMLVCFVYFSMLNVALIIIAPTMTLRGPWSAMLNESLCGYLPEKKPYFIWLNDTLNDTEV